ncbi:transposase (fragment), partial [Azospirillum baldaniorum]
MGDHRTADPAGAAQAKRRTAPVGRSCGADRHPVRAAHGHPLGASAGGDGLRLGDDLLAASARVASGRGMGATASRAARPARLCQRHQLGSGGGGQRQRSSKKGGEETGPNPTDRGKPGSKRHILVDANGIPLALKISPANRHDSKLLETLVDAVPAIRQCAGRPRRRPAKLHADKGYDFAHCRRALRQRAIIPRI